MAPCIAGPHQAHLPLDEQVPVIDNVLHRHSVMCRFACRSHIATAVAEGPCAPHRYARIGAIVMLLHDPSDIFLEAAKLASYAGADTPSTLLFTALLLTWCSLRLGLLPFWVIRSALCGPQPCSVTSRGLWPDLEL